MVTQQQVAAIIATLLVMPLTFPELFHNEGREEEERQVISTVM